MGTPIVSAVPEPRRRRHTPDFKSRIILECQRPGASVAAIALANQLNANQVRRWIKDHLAGKRSTALAPKRTDVATPPPEDRPPALVPVTVESAVAAVDEIRVEVRRQQTTVQITWPASQAAICAQWLRDLLR